MRTKESSIETVETHQSNDGDLDSEQASDIINGNIVDFIYKDDESISFLSNKQYVEECVHGIGSLSTLGSSSSKHLIANKNQEDDLESFRQVWKREIENRKIPGSHSLNEPSIETLEDDERKARALFLEGVEFERNGDMSEAVQRYTKAVKLVPDIERKLYTLLSKQSHSKTQHGHQTEREVIPPRSNLISSKTSSNLRNILSERINQREERFIASSPSHSCQIQILPLDILHTLLLYVVGSQLDTRAMEILSETCAMFYVLSRDDDLWRLIISRCLGSSLATQRIDEFPDFSWRELYINTPHVLYDGVYVSKSTYIRHGEIGFQDKSYRPWHTVNYFRLIRFFVDGTILMTTSSDLPTLSVSLLHSKTPTKGEKGVMVGRWNFEDKTIIANVHYDIDVVPVKKNGRKNHCETRIDYGVYRHDFNIRLDIVRTKNNQWGLVWVKNICTSTFFDGSKSVSDMEVDKDIQGFPPMRFIRIKGFPVESYDAKLC